APARSPRPLHAHAREGRPPRPRDRIPAERGGRGRAQGRGSRPDTAGAGRAARLCQDPARRRDGRNRPARRSPARRRAAELLSAAAAREVCRRHRPPREIVTTVIANELVNRAGITFVHEVREGTGMGAADVARAYLAAREIFSVGQLWQQVEALDNKVSGGLQSTLLLECGRVIERGTTWLLRNEPQRLDIAATVKTYRAGVEALVAAKGLIADADRAAIDQRVAKYVEQGLSKTLAQRMAIMHLLPPSLDIV